MSLLARKSPSGRSPAAVSAVHIVAEAKPAAVGQLHHRGGRENLADGSDAPDRGFWIDRLAPRDVGKTVPALIENLSVLHQQEDRARDVLLRDLLRDQGVDEPRQLCGIDRAGDERAPRWSRRLRVRCLRPGAVGYRQENDR